MAFHSKSTFKLLKEINYRTAAEASWTQIVLPEPLKSRQKIFQGHRLHNFSLHFHMKSVFVDFLFRRQKRSKLEVKIFRATKLNSFFFEINKFTRDVGFVVSFSL